MGDESLESIDIENALDHETGVMEGAIAELERRMLARKKEQEERKDKETIEETRKSFWDRITRK